MHRWVSGKLLVNSFIFAFIVIVSISSAWAVPTSLVLTHGPLVGAVSATSAKIWVRTNLSAAVQVEYSTSPEFVDSVFSERITTAPERDPTGKVRLPGLNPETAYFYRVWANGAVLQGVYQFKTSPWNAAIRTFRFAVLSDFKRGAAPVYAVVAQEAPTFVIFLGDFDHSDPSTLPEMRDMHRRMRGSESAAGAEFRKHITPFPFYHVWDDHDFGVDSADKTFPGKKDALEAFREYFPTPDLPSSDGIWHHFRYAQAEFFMLDLRSQRDPNYTLDGPDKSILGIEQKAWLKDGLLNSTARWKFLMSPVPFNPGTKPKDSWGGMA